MAALEPYRIDVPDDVLADLAWTELPRGGHFPSMEVPDLFVGDVREFFRPLRQAPA